MCQPAVIVGPLPDPVDLEVADVVGEAEHDAVVPGDLPAGGERRDLAREVLGESGADGLHLVTDSSSLPGREHAEGGVAHLSRAMKQHCRFDR